jgi:Protein of unknown function (DUF3443)
MRTMAAKLSANSTVLELSGAHCGAIDQIKVDTGSVGLRVLSSALSSQVTLT